VRNSDDIRGRKGNAWRPYSRKFGIESRPQINRDGERNTALSVQHARNHESGAGFAAYRWIAAPVLANNSKQVFYEQ